MRQEYVCGFNSDGDILTAEIDTDCNYRNGYQEFTACFNVYKAVNITEWINNDSLEFINDIIESSSKEWLIEQCDYYDCSPQNLAKEILDNDFDVYANLAISSNFEIMQSNNDEWGIVLEDCGQLDLRKEHLSYLFDEQSFNSIYELWDSFHLKNVEKNSDYIETIMKTISLPRIEDFNEKFLKTYYETVEEFHVYGTSYTGEVTFADRLLSNCFVNTNFQEDRAMEDILRHGKFFNVDGSLRESNWNNKLEVIEMRNESLKEKVEFLKNSITEIEEQNEVDQHAKKQERKGGEHQR